MSMTTQHQHSPHAYKQLLMGWMDVDDNNDNAE